MKKSSSLKTKLLKAMMIVVLVQSCIYIIFIFGSGAIKNIETNAYNNVAATSNAKKNDIESMLNRYKNSLDGFEKDFNSSLQEQAKALNLDLFASLNADQIYHLLNPFTPELVSLAKSASVNGCFVVLDGNGATEKSTLYLRRLDTSSVSLDNSDILAEYGIGSIFKDNQITLDSHWSPYLELEKMSYTDFYTKPLEAVENYPNLKSSQYGYWSEKFNLKQNDLEIFTYTVPLIDKNGKSYGIIGIEVSTSLLSQSMKYNDLNVDEMGGYLLASNIKNKGLENNEYRLEFINSPYLKSLLSQPMITLSSMQDIPDIANVSFAGLDEDLVASVQPLNIYEKNGPFSKEKWYLMGIVSKDTLLSTIYTMDNAIILSFILAMVSAVSIAIISSSNISKALLKVIKRLKQSNPDSKIELGRVNINEIDELSKAIEILSADVAFNASRLTQILDATELPLGAIEHKPAEGTVYCTPILIDLLGMPMGIDLSNEEQITEFFKTFRSKIIQFEEDIPNFTCLVPINEQQRWIRFNVNKLEDRSLVVVTDVTKEKIELQQMAYERDYDVLTNLLNRRAFKERAIELINQNHDVIACVLWDLDNLKYVNDTYGHDYGDIYIQQGAMVLNSFDSDKAIVSRLSGDEFIALIYGYNSVEDVLNEIKRVHGALSKTRIKFLDDSVMRLRASAGISWYKDDAHSYDQLIKHADFAMYDAKRRQKGIVISFNEESYERDKILLNDTELLNQMLDTMAVRYAFQPIVSLKTGEVFAYEGLMRPQIANLKYPSDVMRLAKSQSKLYYIEQMTWYRVLEDYSEQVAADGKYKLFVNSVPNTCLSPVDMNHIQDTYGDYLSDIVIEMIESEQADLDRFETKLEQMNRWHAEVAIDDFGTGYSSESTVLTMHPEYVKIDISLITNIDKDMDKQLMVKSFLSYTKAKGIKVIGEGVETYEELQTLIQLDLDFVQGFYVGKPNYEVKDIEITRKQEILKLNDEFNR